MHSAVKDAPPEQKQFKSLFGGDDDDKDSYFWEWLFIIVLFICGAIKLYPF